jgi:hypothetical protein
MAAVLILLFDIGHAGGYPWSDSGWGVDRGAMRSTRFTIFGSRSSPSACMPTTRDPSNRIEG